MRQVICINITNGVETVETVEVIEEMTDQVYRVRSRRLDGALVMPDKVCESMHAAIAHAFGRGGFDVPNISRHYMRQQRAGN